MVVIRRGKSPTELGLSSRVAFERVVRFVVRGLSKGNGVVKGTETAGVGARQPLVPRFGSTGSGTVVTLGALETASQARTALRAVVDAVAPARRAIALAAAQKASA